MTKELFNDTIKILTLWIIEESISDSECTEKLMKLGFDLDSIDLLIDIVNTPSVLNIGVKQIIIDYLDQSYMIDDELDSFKSEIAERLGISYDRQDFEDPYQDYLKYDSGVYA
jgi:ribosome assembly protein YihI (activator of Der GTPase)